MPKTLAPSTVTSRDRKGLKFMSIVSAAYDKAGLNDEEAQRVNDTPGLPDLINNFIAENRLTDKFKNEEVESNFGYLSGYKPNGLVAQTNRLRELFPGLGFANQDLLTQIEKGEVELPPNTEGWFAIPNWMKNPELFGSTYSGALQKVLDKIKETRNGRFHNFREGQINENRLRQSARSKQFWKDLSDAQGNSDILIVPAQFGLRHRGRSVRRAREVIATTVGEFGLGAFAVGIMVLTHPERLQHLNDLWIDCAGDEFDGPGSGARFGFAPFFRFDDGEVGFGTRWVSAVYGYFGSASGFLPAVISCTLNS